MIDPMQHINGVNVKRPNSEEEFGLDIYGQRVYEYAGDEEFIYDNKSAVEEVLGKKAAKNIKNTTQQINIEDMQKKLAEEQKWYSQLFNGLIMQGLIGEVAVGTLKGFSELYDVAATLIQGEHMGAYVNPVTEMLEGWQEGLRENFAVHRKNPEKAFDTSDLFAYLMSNVPNMLTTVSLMLPSLGVTKALSMAGKGVGKLLRYSDDIAKVIGKESNTVYNTLNWINKNSKRIHIEDTGIIAKNIENFNETLSSAMISRTVENFQEAREVFNSGEQDMINFLNTLSDEELDTWRESHPEYKDKNKYKSRKDIAKDVAGKASTETFVKDYALLLIDFMQFKSMGKVLNGKADDFIETGAKIFNKEAAGLLGKESVEQTAKKTIFTKAKDLGIYYATHPLEFIKTMEVSEMFEEMYQGIASDRGGERIKLLTDPYYTRRSLGSYLTDPHIWEQGVWGMLGGTTFKAAGKQLEKIPRYWEIWTNKSLTDEQIADLKRSREDIQIEEIKNRKAKFDNFVSNIHKINQGFNPFELETDNEGKPIMENDEYVYKQIETSNSETRESLKQKAINAYIADLYSNAAFTGTAQLLDEYVNSAEFDKALIETGALNQDEIGLGEQIKKSYETVKTLYNNAIRDIYSNVAVDNDYVAKAATLDIVKRQMELNDLDININTIQEQIDELFEDNSEDRENAKSFEYKRFIIKGKMYLNQLDSEIKHIEKMFENGVISKSARDGKIKELNAFKTSILQSMAASNYYGLFNEEDAKNLDNIKKGIHLENLDDFINNIDERLNEYTNNYLLKGDNIVITNDRAKELINEKNEKELRKAMLLSQTPNNSNDYIDIYNEFSLSLNKLAKNKYDNAIKTIEDYIRNSENVDEAFNNIINEENIPENIKEAAKIVKYGDSLFGTQDNIRSIEKVIKDKSIRDVVESEKKKRIKDATPTSNNADLTEKQKKNADEAFNELEKLNEDDSTTSTGEQKKTTPTRRANKTKTNAKEEVEEEATEEDLDKLGKKDDLDTILKPEKEQKDDGSYTAIGIPKQEQKDDSRYAELSRNEVIYEKAKILSNKIILDIIDKYIEANNISDVNTLGAKSKKYQEMYEEIIKVLNEDARITDEFKKEFFVKAKIRNIFRDHKKSKGITTYDKLIADITAEIIALSKNNEDELKYSLTDTILTADEIIEAFNNYIKYYIENNKFIKEIVNDKQVLDVNLLLKYLIENDILNKNQLIDFIKKLNEYKDNEKFNYSLFNTTSLEKYKNNYGDLINEIKDIIKQEKLAEERKRNGTVEASMRIDGSQGILFNKKRVNVEAYRNLVNRLLEDSTNKLMIVYDYFETSSGKIIKGIKYKIVNKDGFYYNISEIYKNSQGEYNYKHTLTSKESNDNIEVGYISLVDKNSTNTSYKLHPLLFKDIVLNNGGFMWNVDQNGCLDDNINNLFLTLIESCDKDKSDNNKKLFDLFRKLERFDAKNEDDIKDVLTILNHPLIKALRIGHADTHSGKHSSFGANGIGVHYINDKATAYYIDSKSGEIRYYKDEKSNNEALTKIANMVKYHVNSILFHDIIKNTEKGNINKDGLVYSYQMFLYKVYINYIQSSEIQSKLDDISSLPKGSTHLDSKLVTNFAGFEKMEFSISEFAQDIGELKENFDYGVHNHPVVIVSENANHLVIDGRDEESESTLAEDSNSNMGVILGYKDADVNQPIIYWIPNQNMNSLYNNNDSNNFNKSRKELCDAVRKETKKIIKEYLESDKSAESFKTLNNKLSQLLGGTIGSRSNILSGVKLIARKDKKALLFSFGEKQIDKLDGKDIADLAILIDESGNVKFTERNKKGILTKTQNLDNSNIDHVVEKLISNLRFNKSYAVLRPKANVSNQYFTVIDRKNEKDKSNKLVIKIGDYEKEYESYTDFLYENDAFSMNIDVDPISGSPFNTTSNNDRTDAILIDYIDVKHQTSSPVGKESVSYDQQGLTDLLVNSKGKPINVADVLLKFGFTTQEIDFYLGNNPEGISIIPDQIYYSPNDDSGAHTTFGETSKKISITKSGLIDLNEAEGYENNIDKDIYRRHTIRRNLIHEHIHSVFDRTRTMKAKQTVEDIIKTYISAIESLNKLDPGDDKILQDLKDYVNEFFKPIIDENTGKINIEETVKNYYTKAYNKRKYDANKARKMFAEEWITECLSQSSLLEYLANTAYTENGEIVEFEKTDDSNNNSIFKKIINILLDLFGINLYNSKNNTIFARQYQILIRDDNKVTPIVRKKKSTVKENNNVNNNVESHTDTDDGNNNNVNITPIIPSQDQNIFEGENLGDFNINDESDFENVFSKTRTILTKEEVIFNNANKGNINTDGILSASDMETFLEIFPNSVKPTIAKNIENGDIKYVCK